MTTRPDRPQAVTYIQAPTLADGMAQARAQMLAEGFTISAATFEDPKHNVGGVYSAETGGPGTYNHPNRSIAVSVKAPEDGPSWPPTPAAAAPYWDRFDICLAWHHFATDYHAGQWSPEYAIHGRLDALQYRPGLAGDRLTRCEDHENARAILANMIRRHRAGLTIIRDN